MDFNTPIPPLTRRQRAIVGVLALVCAASRFLAIARSAWEWDEILFLGAMRDYDVTLHHPHPPGFPVYIAMGRLARLLVASDFRALQTVNLIAAVLVFPAVYVFARELGLRFPVAVIAAALFAFLPNVWFFGGGAFSDIPSIVLVLFAVTCLFRGVRSRNAYWLGTLLLALAIGIRPQNLLIGLAAGLLASRKRPPFEVVVALLIGLAVVAAAFGGASLATGSFDDYIRVVQEHSDYISRVDSWRSPERPSLWRLFGRFFLKQYQSTPLSFVASLFVVMGVAGAIRERNRSQLWNALTFTPFAVVAWMMLDRYSISRFSIGYQPMFAIFAAGGIWRVASYLSSRWKGDESPAGQLRAQRIAAAIAVVLIGGFAAYTLPALSPVRNEIAPSMKGAQAVSQHVDLKRERLYVGRTVYPFVDLVNPGAPYIRVVDDRAMPLSVERPAWILAEITKTGDSGFVFRRERGNLWNIARRKYFAVKLDRVQRRPVFVSGWYSLEWSEGEEWRWMRARSVTHLPPAEGATLLRVHLGLPSEVMQQSPVITVRLNGLLIEEIRTAEGYVEGDYRVKPAPNGQPNVLELSIDRTFVRVDDGRELGLRLQYLAWGPL